MNPLLPFCCVRICNPCLSPGDPILGLSSEDSDHISYISIARGTFGMTLGDPFNNPEDGPYWPPPGHAGTPGFNSPPLGSNWTMESCGDFAVSTIDQDDADQVAMTAAMECIVNEWPPTVPPNTNDNPTA